MNPFVLAARLKEAVKKVTAYLADIATPIATEEDFRKVATISSQDVEIGNIIAECYSEVGKDGIVTVEE